MIYVILGSLLVIVARTMELISPRTIKKKKKKKKKKSSMNFIGYSNSAASLGIFDPDLW